MYNTAYSNLSSQPKSREYKLDLNTIGKIADIKSTLYEQAYNEISNLKASTLNLTTYNPYAKDKIKKYNDEIQNFFKTNDLKNIDLNNGNIVSQYKQVFDKINSDTELKNYYRHEKEQEQVMRTYADAAKNPAKTGYNQSNHIVWMHENWKPMVESNDLVKATQYSGNYLPGYDVRKDLDSVKANLKFNGSTVDIIEPNGRKTTVMKEELSSSRIQGYLRNIGLSQQALNQLENDSKASSYMLWDAYKDTDRQKIIENRASQEKTLLQEQIDQNLRQKEYNLAKINILKNKKGNEEQVKQLEDENNSYDVNINLLKSSVNTPFPTDKFGFAKRVANFDVSRKIKNMGDHMAYSIQKIYKNIDAPFFASKKLELETLRTKSQLEKDQSIIAKNYASMEDDKDSDTSTGNKISASGGMNISGLVPGDKPVTYTLDQLEAEKQEASKAIELVRNIVHKPGFDKEAEEFIRSSLSKKEGEMTPLDLQISRLDNVNKNNYPAILVGLQELYKKGQFNDYLENKADRLEFVTNTINNAWTKYKDINLGSIPKEEREEIIRKQGKSTELVGKLNEYISEDLVGKYNPAYIISTEGKFKSTEEYLKGVVINSVDPSVKNVSPDLVTGPFKYDPTSKKLTFNVYTDSEKKDITSKTIDVPTNSLASFPKRNETDVLFDINGGRAVRDWVDSDSKMRYTVKVERVRGSDEKTFTIQAKNLTTGVTRTVNSVDLGLTLNGVPSDILTSVRSNINEFFK